MNIKISNPIYHPDRAIEEIRYALDSTKIKRTLKWEPKVSLEEGLAKTYKWTGKMIEKDRK